MKIFNKRERSQAGVGVFRVRVSEATLKNRTSRGTYGLNREIVG